MRGLESLGQTLELWIVPEVQKMINEAAITMGAQQVGEQDSQPATEREQLYWVMRWLIANTLDSEAMQAAQLAIQGVRSSFRSPAIQFLCTSQAVVQHLSKSRDEPCFRSRFVLPYVGDAAAEWRAKCAVEDEIWNADSRFTELWKGRLRLSIKDLEKQNEQGGGMQLHGRDYGRGGCAAFYPCGRGHATRDADERVRIDKEA
jgi:hypothetical protein